MAMAKGIYSIGRRKAASARVFLTPVEGEGAEASIVVNNRAFEKYFPQEIKQQVIMQPLVLTERADRYNFKIRVIGGGSTGQSGAVLLGIARALEKAEPELRAPLKKAGFLTRDARVVERKKPGRHKARKKPQFSKR